MWLGCKHNVIWFEATEMKLEITEHHAVGNVISMRTEK